MLYFCGVRREDVVVFSSRLADCSVCMTWGERVRNSSDCLLVSPFGSVNQKPKQDGRLGERALLSNRRVYLKFFNLKSYLLSCFSIWYILFKDASLFVGNICQNWPDLSIKGCCHVLFTIFLGEYAIFMIIISLFSQFVLPACLGPEQSSSLLYLWGSYSHMSWWEKLSRVT